MKSNAMQQRSPTLDCLLDCLLDCRGHLSQCRPCANKVVVTSMLSARCWRKMSTTSRSERPESRGRPRSVTHHMTHMTHMSHAAQWPYDPKGSTTTLPKIRGSSFRSQPALAKPLPKECKR